MTNYDYKEITPMQALSNSNRVHHSELLSHYILSKLIKTYDIELLLITNSKVQILVELYLSNKNLGITNQVLYFPQGISFTQFIADDTNHMISNIFKTIYLLMDQDSNIVGLDLQHLDPNIITTYNHLLTDNKLLPQVNIHQRAIKSSPSVPPSFKMISPTDVEVTHNTLEQINSIVSFLLAQVDCNNQVSFPLCSYSKTELELFLANNSLFFFFTEIIAVTTAEQEWHTHSLIFKGPSQVLIQKI